MVKGEVRLSVRALALTIAATGTSIDPGVLSAETTRQQVAVEVGDNYYKPATIHVRPEDRYDRVYQYGATGP